MSLSKFTWYAYCSLHGTALQKGELHMNILIVLTLILSSGTTLVLLRYFWPE